MPFTYNGIGTWYYGKRRIHTRRGVCPHCKRQVDLASYDTTLFFVILHLPIIPIQQKRILQECSACRRHGVLSLAKWEAAKAKDAAQLMENLSQNAGDREAMLQAISFTMTYQDEPLLNNIVDTYGVASSQDAAIQTQLGHAYVYFVRWADAERAYRASLAIEESEDVREQLAVTLLKQGRPADARPYLQHVIDSKKQSAAGHVYMLVDSFQSQGLHEEALAIIEQRDLAFPQFAESKEYRRQRKDSTRYRDTGKKLRSVFPSEVRGGYREGNWTARAPRWIAAAILLSIPTIYLAAAIWMGQSRKVYIVNGTNKPYSVVAGGAEHSLPPGSVTPIRVAEGNVQVAFKDPALDPINVRIETNFWSRPFSGHTFVINPDAAAIVLEQEAFYAAANPPPSGAPTIHFGDSFYSLPGADYEFQPFPESLRVNEHSTVRKTRVAPGPFLATEQRLNLIERLNPADQIPFCKRQLRFDPSDSVYLYWLDKHLTPAEMIELVEPRLEDLPVLVDWHRLYQTLMDREHPDVDLRPRYRKLLAESKGQADALYLLGRAETDLEESDRLFRDAASANPPSGQAIVALGYHALCEGRFGDAIRLLNRALPLAKDRTTTRGYLNTALFANHDYVELLKELQTEAANPDKRITANLEMMRVHAASGDKLRTRQALDAAVNSCPIPERDSFRKALELYLFRYEQDPDGLAKAEGAAPGFSSLFLRGKLAKAAEQIKQDDPNSLAFHSLLYLQATRSGSKEIAESEWKKLLDGLNKSSHEERIFAEILTGKRKPTDRLTRGLYVNPDNKRVLLLVLAQRYPDSAKEMVELARRLDYQRDGISLCLATYRKKS